MRTAKTSNHAASHLTRTTFRASRSAITLRAMHQARTSPGPRADRPGIHSAYPSEARDWFAKLK